MYTEKVMDHFMHPRNVGEIDNASGRRHGRQREVRRHHAHLPGYRREQLSRREVQDLWLWRGDCDQFDGYGDDYWQDNSGGAGSDQQGSHGSAGRSAAGQGALLPAGRAGGAWAALWDYAQKNNITIEGLKPPVNDVDELEEAHEDEA